VWEKSGVKFLQLAFVTALAGCAVAPETATYGPRAPELGGTGHPAIDEADDFDELALEVRRCDGCECVMAGWLRGAALLQTPEPAYAAIYGSAYPPYAYVGEYTGLYTDYNGFDFCPEGPYTGYPGYGGYGGPLGPTCRPLGGYVNALAESDARLGCEIFDKP
jgi:hypothetical protein